MSAIRVATHEVLEDIHMYSPQFEEPDADLTLRSSDGHLFKCHSRNLSAFSTIFPPSSFVDPSIDAVVQVTESSKVLEIVLQFMRKERPMDLSAVAPGLIAEVAEAVEKYEICQSMDICRFHMERVLEVIPFSVLTYACKHDYKDLANKAAHFALRVNFDPLNLPSETPTNVLFAWLLWRCQWDNLCSQIRVAAPSPHKDPRTFELCGLWAETCVSTSKAIDDVLNQSYFGNDKFAVLLDKILPTSQPRLSCTNCSGSIFLWGKRIRGLIENKGYQDFIFFFSGPSK